MGNYLINQNMNYLINANTNYNNIEEDQNINSDDNINTETDNEKRNIKNNTTPHNLFNNNLENEYPDFPKFTNIIYAQLNKKIKINDETQMSKKINTKLSKLKKWKIEVNDQLINNVVFFNENYIEKNDNKDIVDNNNIDDNGLNIENNETNDFYIKDGIFILKKNIKQINNYGMYYYKNLNNIKINETNIEEKFLEKIKERNETDISHQQKYNYDEQTINQYNDIYKEINKNNDKLNSSSNTFLQLVKIIKEKR
jgi:hypothetical protein